MTQPLPCPICQSLERKILFTAHDFDGHGTTYQLIACNTCSTTYTSPPPSQAVLSNLYNNSYYGGKKSKFSYLIESWSLFAAKKRAQCLIKMHGSSSKKLRILDIGCGRGVLLKAFRELGHDAYGLERADSPFSGEPFVHCGTLEEMETSAESFDIIVLWHVLEHVEAPQDTLIQANKILNGDGSLFISVPNFGSFQAKLFKKHWFHLDLPRHLYHFTSKALNTTLNNAGFKIVNTNTASIDQNTFGFLQSSLNLLPKLKDNHFYSLLKQPISIKSGLSIILYSLPVIPISFLALAEFGLSSLLGNGASLNVKAKKKTYD